MRIPPLLALNVFFFLLRRKLGIRILSQLKALIFLPISAKDTVKIDSGEDFMHLNWGFETMFGSPLLDEKVFLQFKTGRES